MATKIDPKRICIDLDTQIRVDWNEEAVREYAEAMESGVEFPPLLVFYDEPNHRIILADGFHRLAAHKLVKPNDQILVEQRLGDVEDARWAAIIANQSHGIRRTNADKRNAVRRAFLHKNGEKSTNSQISKDVGVHHVTVGSIRREMELSCEIRKIETRIVQRGDQIYEQNTARIGLRRKEDSPEEGNSSENNIIEKKQPSFPVNTSRINFGGKIVPEGATCVTCRFLEDGKCLTDEIDDPVPCIDVCGEYEVRVEEAPREEIAPPDYENAEPLGKKLNKQTRQQRLYQNRDLKNCITVRLPSNNAEVFAVELREHWEKPYLIECLAALKHLLAEENEND